jgi:hypothetical protein
MQVWNPGGLHSLRRVQAIVLVVAFFLSNCLPSFAQPVPVNLDLSSTQRTNGAPTTEQSAVSINVGGTVRMVTATDALTAAERMAVMQILQSGMQSILIGANGNAIGGQVSLTATTAEALANLVIPSGVTAVRDFGIAKELNVIGNLTNSGSLYALSTNEAVNTAVINATNVFNNQGAVLSSVLPASLVTADALASLHLHVNAVNDVINAGVIKSSGNLSIVAGGSIVNALPAGVSGAAPSMEAANSLNLIANNIINSGAMVAVANNISISATNTSQIVVNNIGGTMQALLGSINFRDANFSAKSNLDILGGSLLSKEVNVFSGEGIANINVRDLTGRLNVKAGEVHVSAETANLFLGDMYITGDPTFFNVAGDVTIGGSLAFAGQPLAIVASRNIISETSVPSVISTTTAGAAGKITLIAGADITSDGPPTGQNDTTSTITLKGPSSTGGKIDFTGGAGISLIDASSSGAAGGDVQIYAFDGSLADSGMIRLTNTDILTKGSGSNSNGNVVIMSGMSVGNSITVGDVTTGGGTGTSNGDITIISAEPKLATETPITITNGVLSEQLETGNKAFGNLSIGMITATSANDVLIETRGNLSLPSQTIDVSNTSGTGGTIALIFGSYTNVAPLGTVFLKADGSSQGGKVLLRNQTPEGDIVVGETGPFKASAAAIGTTGSAGTIAVVAGRNLTVDTPSASLILTRGATSGKGGNLILAAGYYGEGNLSINGNINVSGRGSGLTGTGGSISLLSASTEAFTIDPITPTPNGITGTLIANSDQGNGGSISVTNGKSGGVLIKNLGNISVKSIGGSNSTGGHISLNSLQEITLPIVEEDIGSFPGGPTAILTGTNNLIDASASGSVAGGTIDIGGTALNVTGQYLHLLASGSTAGKVSVTLQDNNAPGTENVTLGVDSGQVRITNNGIYNSALEQGLVSVQVGGNLTVNPDGINASGTSSGASIELLAQGNLKINGSLSANASSTSSSAAGGSLVLFSGPLAAGEFTFGPLASANGITGTVSATGPNGGSIQIFSQRGISLLSPSSINVAASGGDGGFIVLASTRPPGLPASSLHNDLNLPQSVLTVGKGTLAANAGGSNGFGGQIFIDVDNIVFKGLLTVSAFGVNNGQSFSAGGFVSVTSRFGSINVGSQLKVNANSDKGTGTTGGGSGFVTVVAGRDLTVTPSALNISPSGLRFYGAYYYLRAGLNGPGNLKVSGSLNASPSVPEFLIGQPFFNGGGVTLISNSALPFTVGAASSNSISGSIQANGIGGAGDGGSIQIINTGTGGISVPKITSISAKSSNSMGGFINLGDDIHFSDSTSTPASFKVQPAVVSGRGPLTLGAGTLNVNATGNNGTGGIVRLAGKDITVKGGALSIQANGSGSGLSAGSGGGVYITTTNGNIVIGNLPGQINISAAGNQTPTETYSTPDGQGTGKLATVDIAAGGDLTVLLPANVTTTGHGAHVSLQAGISGAGSLSTGGTYDLRSSGETRVGGTFTAIGGNCATCTMDIFSVLVSGPSFASGNAGSITVRVLRDGTATIHGDLKAEGGMNGGNGGDIRIGPEVISEGSPGGVVAFDGPSTINISSKALGTNSQGGDVSINSQVISLGTRHVNVTADSLGTAAGASVTIQALDALSSLSIGSGPGQISISATGAGTTDTNEAGGILATNGVRVSVGAVLTVSAASLTVGTTTNNTQGGNIALHAGEGGSGFFLVSGNLDVSGKGTGSGGTIELSQNSSGGLVVDNTNVFAGVLGTIFAKSGPGGGNGGLISLRNSGTGGIFIMNAANLSITGQGNGGTLIMDAKGEDLTGATVVLAGGTYSADAVAGKGGFISISGGKIQPTGSVTLTAQGNGSGQRNGGTITLEQISEDLLSVGTAGNLKLLADGGANGGNAGSISVVTAGDLTVDTSISGFSAKPRGANGNGGNFSLTAGSTGPGNLLINGSINASGGSTLGNGGSIELTSNSSESFQIFGSSCSNCSTGTLSANATTGNGGSISITNLGGGITLGALSSLSASPSTLGRGGTILLSADQILTISQSGTISVNAIGGQNTGGVIRLKAGSFALPVGGVQLSANAAGTGFGGSVYIETTDDQTDLTISTATFSMSVAGPRGDVTFASARNLTVDPSAITVGPSGLIAGDGAFYDLFAVGNVVVQGAINADANISGSGGSISIRSSSNQAFVIDGGNTITNGTYGALSAQAKSENDGSKIGFGGQVVIVNFGATEFGPNGGITLTTASSISVATEYGHGGAIILDAATLDPEGFPGLQGIAGPITIPTGTYDVSAPAGDYSGGVIEIAGSSISNVDLHLIAKGSGIGSGGTITVRATDETSNLTLETGKIVIEVGAGANGSISGTVAVMAGGDLVVQPSGLIYVNNAIGAFGANLEFEGARVAINTILNVSGSLFGDGGNITIRTNSIDPFVIGDPNQGNGSLALISNSGIMFGGDTGGSYGSAGIITVINDGTGGITLQDVSLISAKTQLSDFGGSNRANGGSIALVTSGPLNITTSPAENMINVDSGRGQGDGGAVRLEGETITVNGPALILSAFGARGNISVTTTGTNGDIIIGNLPGQFIVSAEAPDLLGSLDLETNPTADGGTITVSAGRHLIVDPLYLSVNNFTSDGANGGHISLSAGTAAGGNLRVNGDLRADGLGFGSGGTISIVYSSSSTVPFTIGGIIPDGTSGISGVLSASLGPLKAFTSSTKPSGSGNGGSITITNASFFESTNVVLNNNVLVSSFLAGHVFSEDGISGKPGTFSMDGLNSATLTGVGTIVGGSFNARGGIDVSVSLSGATNSLLVGEINVFGDVNINMDRVDIRSGSIIAPSLTLMPLSNSVLRVGSTTHSNVFEIVRYEFHNIFTETLTIGALTKTLGATLLSSIELGGTGFDSDLNIITGGVFNGGGFFLSSLNTDISVTAKGVTFVTLRAENLAISALGKGVTSAVLLANSVNISSVGVGLGTAASALNISPLNSNDPVTAVINVTGTGAVFVNSTKLKLGPVTTGTGAVTISANSIEVVGDINAPVSLTASESISSQAGFTIGRATKPTTLSANGGSISLGNASMNVLGSVITLKAFGDIDLSGVNTPLLKATTLTAGHIDISSNRTLLTTLQASSAVGSFELASQGPIKTSTISALGITIASVGNLTIGGNLIGNAQPISLTAGGTGNLTQSSGTITSNSISLVSGGNIGTSTALRTQTLNLTMQSGGTANAVNTGALSLGASSAGLSFKVAASADITVAGSITAPTVTILAAPVATNFGIIINGDIGNGNGVVTLTAKGGGTISDPSGAGTVFGTKVVLTALNGNIGTSALLPVKTQAASLSANTTGNVFLSNNGDVSVSASKAGSNFSLASLADIQISGIITAPTVSLNAGDALTTSTGTVKSPSVTLSAGAGGINGTLNGFSVGLPSAISSVAVTSTGPASIYQPNSTGTLQLATTSTTTAFSATSAGSLTFAPGASVTSGGDVTLRVTGSSGKLIVGGNISANDGSILIQHTSKSGGSIVFNSGVQVVTDVNFASPIDHGRVTVVIGPIPAILNKGTKPTNLVELESGGAQVYYGDHPEAIIVPAAATAEAKGRDVIFNTPAAARTITINSGVLIKADPPVPSTIPAGPGVFNVNGAITALAKTPQSTAVFNLHDTTHGAATFTVGSQTFPLPPGHVIVVTNNQTTFERANPSSTTAYRNIHEIGTFDHHKIYTAEFSITSLFGDTNSLRSLLKSNNPKDVKLARSIMKTAAILHTLQASRGAFRTIPRLPDLTQR